VLHFRVIETICQKMNTFPGLSSHFYGKSPISIFSRPGTLSLSRGTLSWAESRECARDCELHWCCMENCVPRMQTIAVVKHAPMPTISVVQLFIIVTVVIVVAGCSVACRWIRSESPLAFCKSIKKIRAQDLLCQGTDFGCLGVGFGCVDTQAQSLRMSKQNRNKKAKRGQRPKTCRETEMPSKNEWRSSQERGSLARLTKDPQRLLLRDLAVYSSEKECLFL